MKQLRKNSQQKISLADQQKKFSDNNEKNINKIQKNIIQCHNILCQGINYIVPQFWYEELILLNQKTQSFDSIIIPSLQQYEKMLSLYGIVKPQKSVHSSNQFFQYKSLFKQNDILNQKNYLKSKAYKFSKINFLLKQSWLEWKIINPKIWKLIQAARFNKLKDNQQLVNQRQRIQQLPKIAIFLTKQFIRENKQHIKLNNKNEQDNQQFSRFIFRNDIYFIKNSNLNKQIQFQLRNMITQQLNFIIILALYNQNGSYYFKISVQGYLDKRINFKDLIRHIIKLNLFNIKDFNENWFIYDAYGQKYNYRITDINSIVNNISSLPLAVCSNSLNDIIAFQQINKTQFKILVQNLINNNKQIKSSKQFKQKIKETQYYQSNVTKIKKNLIKNNFISEFLDLKQNMKLSQKNIQCSQFKIQNETLQDKIANGTFFRQQNNQENDQRYSLNNIYINNENQKNQQTRNIDSATTQFDTPSFQQQKSNKVHSEKSFRNKQLHHHSNFKKCQRQKKVKKYIDKKKKINKDCIVQLKLFKNHLNTNNLALSKKRIPLPLFKSLVKQNQNIQKTQTLIQQLKKLSLQKIFKSEDELIPLYYKKQLQKDVPLIFNSKNLNQNNISYIQMKKILLQNKYKSQLENMANILQSKYQMIDQVQIEQKQQKIKLFDDIQNIFSQKKDYQEIKTIVDNNQGINDAQKPNLLNQNTKLNFKQNYYHKSIHKQSQSNDLCLSEGNNSFADNQQTI